MKALVYTATREITYRDEPEPTLGAGDALVAIEAVGICGSDMHAYLGHDARRVPPLILGHEACGIVLEGERAGARVVINPLITCGQCEACREGRDNLCRHRELIGMKLPGAFAQRIAVPERNLIKVPQAMAPEVAALAEPAATSVHAIALAHKHAFTPLERARALVIGGGSVGLFAALALLDANCADVVMAETNSLRRDTARRCGVKQVVDPSAGGVASDAFSLVIDAVGGRVSRAYGSAAIAPGGLFMHIGLMDNDAGLDMRKITLQEVSVIGTYTYTASDLRQTVSLLHSGRLGELSWAEQRRLDEGADAFAQLLAGQCAAPKVLLRPAPS